MLHRKNQSQLMIMPVLNVNKTLIVILSLLLVQQVSKKKKMVSIKILNEQYVL